METLKQYRRKKQQNFIQFKGIDHIKGPFTLSSQNSSQNIQDSSIMFQKYKELKKKGPRKTVLQLPYHTIRRPRFPSQINTNFNSIPDQTIIKNAFQSFIKQRLKEEDCLNIIKFKLNQGKDLQNTTTYIDLNNDRLLKGLQTIVLLLAIYLRIFKILQIIFSIIAVFLLSTDYPFSINLIDALYQQNFFVYWVVVGYLIIGFLFLINAFVSGHVPKRKLYKYQLQQELKSYYLFYLYLQTKSLFNGMQSYGFQHYIVKNIGKILILSLQLSIGLFGLINLILKTSNPILQIVSALGIYTLLLKQLSGLIVSLRIKYQIYIVGRILLYVASFSHLFSLALQWLAISQIKQGLSAWNSQVISSKSAFFNLLYVEYTSIQIITVFNSISTTTSNQTIILLIMLLSASILNAFIYGIIIQFVNQMLMIQKQQQLRISDLNIRTQRYCLSNIQASSLLKVQDRITAANRSIDRQILINDPYFNSKKCTIKPQIQEHQYLLYKFHIYKRNLLAKTPLFKYLDKLGVYSQRGSDGITNYQLVLAKIARFSSICNGKILESDNQVKNVAFINNSSQLMIVQKGLVYFQQIILQKGEYYNIQGLFDDIAKNIQADQLSEATILQLDKQSMVNTLCQFVKKNINQSKIITSCQLNKNQFIKILPKQLQNRHVLSIWYQKTPFRKPISNILKNIRTFGISPKLGLFVFQNGYQILNLQQGWGPKRLLVQYQIFTF